MDQVTHVGPQHGSTTSSKALGGFSCYPDCGDGDKSVPIYNVQFLLAMGWDKQKFTTKKYFVKSTIY